MNKFWKRLLLLLLVSGYLGACQPKRKIINRYSSPLTALQLQNELQERDAELIFKIQSEDSTFVILETDTNVWQGIFSAETFEFDNHTSEASINHSLSSTSKGYDSKVSVQPLTSFETNQEENSQQTQVVVIIRDKTLLNNYKKARFTFSNESQVIDSKSEQRGLLFVYDSSETGDLTSVELLSENDEVLYRVDN
ncbi:MAG: hypothetical protein AAF959_08480 [Cyanobacteria bacterium P01_D01_bin.56]